MIFCLLNKSVVEITEKESFSLEIDTDNLKSESLEENFYREVKRKPGKGPLLVLGNRTSGHPEPAIEQGRANFGLISSVSLATIVLCIWCWVKNQPRKKGILSTN